MTDTIAKRETIVKLLDETRVQLGIEADAAHDPIVVDAQEAFTALRNAAKCFEQALPAAKGLAYAHEAIEAMRINDLADSRRFVFAEKQFAVLEQALAEYAAALHSP